MAEKSSLRLLSYHLSLREFKITMTFVSTDGIERIGGRHKDYNVPLRAKFDQFWNTPIALRLQTQTATNTFLKV